jgi:hypothetical protein
MPGLRAVVPLALSALTLLGGCERRLRAREREAALAEAKARERALAARRLVEQPLPEEPPVATLRVEGSGLPCDVDAVFASKCRRCHTLPPRHAAPLVFLTWEDTRQDRLGQPLYSVIGRAVRTDFMPYKIEANPKVLPLTPEEKRIILDWVEAGGPRGGCDSAPAATMAATVARKPRPPTSVRPPTSARPLR